MRTLDIHGKLVSEAQLEIKYFITESYQNRDSVILIIHGHGKYLLKKCVEDYCIDCKYVEKYEVSPPQIGGSGATLIYIKTRR